MADGVASDSRILSDTAVERFLQEYDDPHHAVMDWRLAYSVVKRLLCPLAGRAVLDYGCGDGRFARLLRDRKARVTGVDISGKAIEQAREKSSRGIAYHPINSGDLSVIPYRSVDAAVSTFVLCCVQEAEELDLIVKAIYDRLRSGGCYVLAEPHPDGVNRDFYSMRRTPRGELAEGLPLDVQLMDGTGRVLHDFWHSRGAYLEMFRRAGFAVEHVIEPTMSTYPDEPFWKAERTSPPFILFRVRK